MSPCYPLSHDSTTLPPPTRAAFDVVRSFGIEPDRCDVLQNANTLVLRLTETLVARIVQDRSGPRGSTAWFTRENAIAEHLTRHGAPIIPLHPDLPAGPHERDGYPMNFWVYVTRVPEAPEPAAMGQTLRECHEVLQEFRGPLPSLGILTETIAILEDRPPGSNRALFPAETHEMLQVRLKDSLAALRNYPAQPLHGDAHTGNLMNTTRGLLWTDWEDTFTGPVEWDVASLIWNAAVLDGDDATVQTVLEAYGPTDPEALRWSMIARAAVITAWYPILYPQPNAERSEKLARRIAWLKQNAG